jgi:hypothetical protein
MSTILQRPQQLRRVVDAQRQAFQVAIKLCHQQLLHRSHRQCGGLPRQAGGRLVPDSSAMGANRVSASNIRVRVKIMGSQQCRNVGKSQSVLNYDQSHDLHPHPYARARALCASPLSHVPQCIIYILCKGTVMSRQDRHQVRRLIVREKALAVLLGADRCAGHSTT